MPRVQLAVSRIGGVPGVGDAYHTSVLVDGAEFFFSDAGITHVPQCDGDSSEAEVYSHAAIFGNSAEVIDMGSSSRFEGDLLKVLGAKFQPDTYDLLRKNCNSFSDCALTYLLGKRLDAKFRQLESLAASVQSSLPSLLQGASLGSYSPNPAADGFDLEAAVRTLSTWSQPCAKVAAKRRSRLAQVDSAESFPSLQLASGAFEFVDWLSDCAADGVLEMCNSPSGGVLSVVAAC